MKNRLWVLAPVMALASTGLAFAQSTARDEVGGAPQTLRSMAPVVVSEPVHGTPQGVVIFDNGSLVNRPGAGSGGADASALQTNLGMTLFGFGHQQSANNRVADDFTVPTGASWRIETANFYTYQTGSTTTSTITGVNVRIWNGPPGAAGSTVVFGDTTTNRLTTSVFSNIYRVTDTTLTDTARPIMINTVTIGTTLTAGTYWIDWQTNGTLASGPWAPPVTIEGQTTTGNGMQGLVDVWGPAVDGASGQGFPFKLNGPDTVPVALTVAGGNNNGVIEPDEASTIQPSWQSSTALSNVTGTASSSNQFELTDASAAYGNLVANTATSCTAASNCYAGQTGGTRPSAHWDATLTETLSTGSSKVWSLHIGSSFTDVPTTSGFYKFVETMLHKGITGGCGTGIYCPSNTATREQMAPFVLVAKEGAGYSPAACGTPMFADVPASSPFCKFIEELARRGVVSGCGGGNYCPQNAVTREQMSIFVLKTLDPTLNPPACGTPVFADVPASSPFCKYIEELARRGVVSGCGGGNYCPQSPVTREQLSVFISATFSLTLYGI